MLHHTGELQPASEKRLIAIALLVAVSLPAPKPAQAAEANILNSNGHSRVAEAHATAVVDEGEVKTRIVLSDARAIGGQQIGVRADFNVAPGWHVYGKPLPEEYTPIGVTFDNALLSGQNLQFPKPTPVKFAILGETLPVYQGHFTAIGNIILRHELTPGEHRLDGTLSFQECNDNLCKMPKQAQFEIPLWINSAHHNPG